MNDFSNIKNSSYNLKESYGDRKIKDQTADANPLVEALQRRRKKLKRTKLGGS